MLLQVQRVSRSVLPRLQWGALGNWASTEALGKEDQLWGHDSNQGQFWGNSCYKDQQLHLKSDSEWKF